MTDMRRETELIVAYNRVLREARHLMAMHRRLTVLMGVINQDADRLQITIDIAQRLEQEIGATVSQEGNAT